MVQGSKDPGIHVSIPPNHPPAMPLLGSFNLTVQLISGQSVTISVEKLHYIMWVIEKVDKVFDLRCQTYHLVHNDRRLIFHDESQLQDVGVDGPTTLTVVIEGDCPMRVYPWERG
jgi:hypothetical protein